MELYCSTGTPSFQSIVPDYSSLLWTCPSVTSVSYWVVEWLKARFWVSYVGRNFSLILDDLEDVHNLPHLRFLMWMIPSRTHRSYKIKYKILQAKPSTNHHVPKRSSVHHKNCYPTSNLTRSVQFVIWCRPNYKIINTLCLPDWKKQTRIQASSRP